MHQRHTLVYSPQCPNCTRFLDALSRTPVAKEVRLVDVHGLGAEATASLVAVPALIVDGGTAVYGTRAFEWLKQYEADVEPDAAFSAGRGALAFSDVQSAGYAAYSEHYGPFEPVQD